MAVNNPQPDPPGKSAITAAADFIKYTVALGTGALVFSAGLVSDKVTLSPAAAWLLIASWAVLALSVATGILAYSRVPIMLANQNYDIEDKWLTHLGRVHEVAFLLGVVSLGVALALTLRVTPRTTPAAPPSDVKTTDPAKLLLDRSGRLDLIGYVGPFITGSGNALEDYRPGTPPGRESCRCGAAQDVVRELSARSVREELANLLLVGSADIFELRGTLRRRYGSNDGLARARADWVKRWITAPTQQTRTVLTLTVGPAIHGEHLSPSHTSPDRSVAVYGYWMQKQ